MSKVVAIKHFDSTSQESTLINWCLGNTCNFSCSYCPESLHSGSIRWVDYKLALNFCNKLVSHYKTSGYDIEFLFTGGEPTLYASFPKLLFELKKLNCLIGVITNGSRTINWWEKNIHLFDKVVLTYHSEFVDKNYFYKIVELMEDKVDLHINFTMLPSDFNSILDIAKILFQKKSNISITLKPLLKDFGDKMYDYSDEQFNILETYRFKSLKRNVSKRGMMKKVIEDGGEIKCKAVDLIIKNENHWKDWNCNAGLELIYIDYKGDVFRGTCKEGGKITNIHLNEPFEFPSKAIMCNKETCHCLTDIMTTKYL